MAASPNQSQYCKMSTKGHNYYFLAAKSIHTRNAQTSTCQIVLVLYISNDHLCYWFNMIFFCHYLKFLKFLEIKALNAGVSLSYVCVCVCVCVCVFSLMLGPYSNADLAQNRYFEDEAFIGYLKYLQYWQQPEYIKYIM